METTTLRPGLLVSLKTSVRGNVAYRRFDIEQEHRTDDGSALARWETEKVVTDPDELNKATQVRGKCRSLISAVCSASTFGLLCPEADGDKLQSAIDEAQQLAAVFNREAKLTRIGVYVIAGRVAADDVAAVRAINSEVRELLEDMESGLRNLDVAKVREAANKARGIGQMLSPDAAARIQMAIDAARSAARRIVKAGESAAVEIDHAAIRRITESRTAFLDLDDAAEIAAPVDTGRAIDLSPEPESVETVRPAAPAFEIEPEEERRAELQAFNAPQRQFDL